MNKFIPNRVLCFFEQSGTFKNEFKKFGINAFDYDILNEFNNTDFQIDLFTEICKGYYHEDSIFDSFCPEDLIFAFFPCTRFENQINLWYRGQANQQKDWTLEDKINYDLKLMSETYNNYNIFMFLILICLQKNIPLIIENPYSKEHFLFRYSCLKPAIVDLDRSTRGDYFTKPTQFFFFNCEPSHNFIFESCNFNYVGSVTGAKVNRSLIHPEYANRFIREFIL